MDTADSVARPMATTVTMKRAFWLPAWAFLAKCKPQSKVFHLRDQNYLVRKQKVPSTLKNFKATCSPWETTDL